jgi:type II secretory pathway pseudopilin PulG
MKPHVSEGFTVLEVLIVVVFLCIVVMIGWPSLNAALGGYRLSGAAQDVVTALEFAQTAATSGSQTRVTVDAGANTILVEQFANTADLFGGGDELNPSDVDGGTFKPMGNPMNKGTDYKITLSSQDRYPGVDITAVDFGGNNFVTFDALGSPSCGGTVTLAVGSRQMVVTVNSLTGNVTVSG